MGEEEESNCALDDVKYLRKIMPHFRRIWMWSPMRREAWKKAKKEGCATCKKKAPKYYVDHIVPVALDDRWQGRLERLFVMAVKGLQGLCYQCHEKKTIKERRERYERKAERKAFSPRRNKKRP